MYFSEGFPFVLETRSAPRQQARAFDLQGHVRDFVLDRLELENTFAKGVALRCVRHGAVQRCLRDAQGLAGDADSACV